ncbi:hypothetical protein [Tessaracoccus sp. MC1756]|uniref:hypothetical protein n=1 Tax=Tessaracoccus sp. MC1756 TaxID=2760311 RepID=UPI001602AB77|nr:hypothetical protein [Tessaracoccus sp. MC1756]MBB1510606.1 hypothetical protein [Tessaracoccus sp. MC1756]
MTTPGRTVTVTATPTRTTSTSAAPSVPVDVYTTPGHHAVNGREWFTRCEPYSQTTRCRTDIWAHQVKLVDNKPQWVGGWAFNNLTYLPMDRATWGGNPLANTGAWTSPDGRRWSTECGTATTGRNACRSFIWTKVWEPVSKGSATFHQVDQWVFNNLVRFK